jgi:hypothetical protein
VRQKGRLAERANAVDFKKVGRTFQHFDAQGVLLCWPSKRQIQELCLWAVWSHLPSSAVLHERDVNDLLNNAHGFDDPAIWRRSLIRMKLVTRNMHGSDDQRVEQSIPPEAVAMIREVSMRLV